MTIVRLPCFATVPELLQHCDAQGLTPLVLHPGPDGSIRGVATDGLDGLRAHRESVAFIAAAVAEEMR